MVQKVKTQNNLVSNNLFRNILSEQPFSTMQSVILFLDDGTLATSLEKSMPKVILEKTYHCRSIGIKVSFVLGVRFNIDSFFKKPKDDISSQQLMIPATMPPLDDHHISELSYLKSALQKCVRRKNVQLALECAKSFMKCNMKSLLRRLVVIAAEDVYIDNNTSTVIWMYMMMTFQIFHPTKYQTDWLLGYVKSLCETDDYVNYLKDDHIHPRANENTLGLALKLFLNATTLMDGDRAMLTWYYNNLDFVQTEKKFITIQPVDCQSISYVTKEKFPLEAIDFHTNAKMPFIVSNKMNTKERLSPSEIKSLIWTCRSGVNLRKPPLHNEKDLENYQKISHYVDEASKYILYKRKQQD